MSSRSTAFSVAARMNGALNPTMYITPNAKVAPLIVLSNGRICGKAIAITVSASTMLGTVATMRTTLRRISTSMSNMR